MASKVHLASSMNGYCMQLCLRLISIGIKGSGDRRGSAIFDRSGLASDRETPTSSALTAPDLRACRCWVRVGGAIAPRLTAWATNHDAGCNDIMLAKWG